MRDVPGSLGIAGLLLFFPVCALVLAIALFVSIAIHVLRNA